MLEFLSSLAREVQDDLRGLNVSLPAKDIKTQVVVMNTQLKLVSTLYNLPQVLKQIEENKELQAKAKAIFTESQEGGEL